MNAEMRKINVTAVFAAFKTPDFQRRVTPLRFALESGETHEIVQVRRSYADRVGGALHVHFVVKTAEGRYFDIVFDSRDLAWRLLVEVDDALLFNE